MEEDSADVDVSTDHRKRDMDLRAGGQHAQVESGGGDPDDQCRH